MERGAGSQELARAVLTPALFARKGVASRPMVSRGAFLLRGKMRRRAIQTACVVLGVICNFSVSANARARETSMQETKENARMQPKTRAIVDESGRTIHLPLKVRRIVTLAPNLAEIVCDLGAQDKLVAVSSYTDRPATAKAKPSIGMPVSPSLEAIVAAKPDLVLATAVNTWETVNSLTRLGIPVYTTDPHSITDMLRSISDIGDVIGSNDAATALVKSLRTRLDSLHAKLAKTLPATVLFVVWDHPLQSVGGHTFIADALRWAGGASVVRTSQDWPLISMEEVVKLNPEYIVYADNQMGSGAATDSSRLTDVSAAVARHLQQLRANPTWRDIPAVREGRVAVVSQEIDIPAPGLVDVIEQLAQQLHPQIFGSIDKPSANIFRARVHLGSASLEFPRGFSEAILCAR